MLHRHTVMLPAAILALLFDLLLLALGATPGVGALPVALHALAAALTCEVARLSCGDQQAALLAGALFAVGPAHLALYGRGVSLSLGVALALATLVLALGPRPRPRWSAAAFALGLACDLAAAPVVVIVGVARREWPRLHLAVLATVVSGRVWHHDFAAGPMTGWAGQVTAALQEVIPVDDSFAAFAAAAALAAALGFWPRRLAIWCTGFVLFAVPWGLPLGVAGARGTLATAALAALAAEGSTRLRRAGFAPLLGSLLEAAAVAGYAVTAWSRLGR